MVRYTGRQKTITGAVNRNQVGLRCLVVLRE